MTVQVEILIAFELHGQSRAGADAVSPVMDELLRLEHHDNIVDSALSFDADQQQVTIEVVGCGEDEMEALVHGISAIRTAIHAAGGATRQWPNASETWTTIRQESRLASRVAS